MPRSRQYVPFGLGWQGTLNGAAAAWQWQPTLTAHDPNPPIILEEPAAQGFSPAPVSNPPVIPVPAVSAAPSAPTVPTNGSGYSEANASSYATGSIALVAGRLYLAFITGFNNASAQGNYPTISGWDQVVGVRGQTANRTTFTVLRHRPGSDATGTLTIDFAAQTQSQCVWCVIEIAAGFNTSGTNGSGAIAQSGAEAEGTVEATTLTLAAAPAATSMLIGGNYVRAAALDIVPGVYQGRYYTELANPACPTEAASLETEYLANPPDGVILSSWTGASQAYVAGVEVLFGTAAFDPTPLSNPPVAPAPALAGQATLDPAPVSTPPVIPAPAITTASAVVPVPVAVTPAVPQPTIETAGAFSPAPVANPPALLSPVLSAAATVELAPVAGPPVAPSPALNAAVAFDPTPVSTPPVVTSPALDAPSTILPTPLAVTPAAPPPALGAAAALSPAPVSTSPTIVAPALVAASADGFTPTPVVGTVAVPAPALAAAADFIPVPLNVAPTVVPPALSAPTAQDFTPSPLTSPAVVLSPALVLVGGVVPTPAPSEEPEVVFVSRRRAGRPWWRSMPWQWGVQQRLRDLLKRRPEDEQPPEAKSLPAADQGLAPAPVAPAAQVLPPATVAPSGLTAQQVAEAIAADEAMIRAPGARERAVPLGVAAAEEAEEIVVEHARRSKLRRADDAWLLGLLDDEEWTRERQRAIDTRTSGGVG